MHRRSFAIERNEIPSLEIPSLEIPSLDIPSLDNASFDNASFDNPRLGLDNPEINIELTPPYFANEKSPSIKLQLPQRESHTESSESATREYQSSTDVQTVDHSPRDHDTKNWTPSLITLAKEYQYRASSLQFMYNKSSLDNKRLYLGLNIVLTLVIAVIATIEMIIRFGESTLDRFSRDKIAIVRAILLYLSALLNGALTFLKLEEKSEKLRVASIRLWNLAEHIAMTTLIQKTNATEYVEWCVGQIELITTSTPIVFDYAKIQFDRTFGNRPVDNASTTAMGGSRVINVDGDASEKSSLTKPKRSEKEFYEMSRFRLHSFVDT